MTRIYRTFGTVTAAVLANVSMFGQAALQPIIISATEPRPLESVGKLFERRFGIPVSYEDAAYAYSGDVIDQTSQEYKKAHPEARALSPKGDGWNFAASLVRRCVPQRGQSHAPSSGGRPQEIWQSW